MPMGNVKEKLQEREHQLDEVVEGEAEREGADSEEEGSEEGEVAVHPERGASWMRASGRREMYGRFYSERMVVFLSAFCTRSTICYTSMQYLHSVYSSVREVVERVDFAFSDSAKSKLILSPLPNLDSRHFISTLAPSTQ